MATTVEVEWTHPEFGFEAKDANGLTMRMDNSPAGGGNNYGVSPMQSLLMAMGGCSGIDMVDILKKQRQKLTGFRMHIEGERETGVVPALWKHVFITFQLTGEVDILKAKRAALLSIDKYCSVAETLRRAGCEISWKVEVNGRG